MSCHLDTKEQMFDISTRMKFPGPEKRSLGTVCSGGAGNGHTRDEEAQLEGIRVERK